ncbi:MAG: hypothetical protein V4792_19980 [Pseudomonadota bacterium]
MSTWDASAQPSRDFDEQDEETWEATRQQAGLATQLMRDKDEYLAQAQRHVGRQVGESQWELFVVIDPTEALQQQFDLLKPEYVALHDIGTLSSRRMLAGLAVAMGRPVHQLHVRRQGLGMPLARLEFVELPVAPGQPVLRLYTTEVDADTQQRRRLSRLLLAHSRLAVVIVGDLPPHALATALLPLHDAIKEGPWHNRELLMLPLAGASALASQASHLAIGTSVQVRTTPLVTRPAEAWNYLRGSWNKLRLPLRDKAVHLPEVLDPVAPPTAPTAPAASAAPAQKADTGSLLESATNAPPRPPLPMQPMPAVRSAAPPRAAPVDPALATYIRKCGDLKGMVSCCVFELGTQRTIGHAGARPGPAALASQGASLMASMAEAAHALNLGEAAPDAAITLGSHHQLLRAVPARPGLALHAVLDRSLANLTLVRLQLQRLDLLLEDGDTA